MKQNIKAPRLWPLWGNSPHKGPVTQKMFQIDDVIMSCEVLFIMQQWFTVDHVAPLELCNWKAPSELAAIW